MADCPFSHSPPNQPLNLPLESHIALCVSSLNPSPALALALMSHRHSGACGCAEDAKQADATGTSLFASIDQDRVWCLNEAEADAGRRCMRQAWHERNEERGRLLSDPDDGEMLLHIPFTAGVHVRSISIMAWGDWRPKKIKLSAQSKRRTSAACDEQRQLSGIFSCRTLKAPLLAAAHVRFSVLLLLPTFLFAAASRSAT